MSLTPLTVSMTFITDDGRILTQFDHITEEELVEVMDDTGSRNIREPHENTYIYAGIVRMANDHHAVLEEKIGEYIGDKRPFRSKLNFSRGTNYDIGNLPKSDADGATGDASVEK